MRRWTLLLVVFLAFKGLAVTYYMSPSGDNSNSGRDTTQAWATLAYATSAASGVSPGDTVLIMNGRYTGYEQNVGVEVEVNGTPGNRIVFKAYPGHHPIFDGEATVTTDDHWYHYGVLMHVRGGGSYTVWDGIDIRNIGTPETGDNTENGCFYVRGAHDITFKNCVGCSTYGGGGNLCGGWMICDAERIEVLDCTSYVHYWWGYHTANQACFNIFSGIDGSGEDIFIKRCYGYSAMQGVQVKSYEEEHVVVDSCVFRDCNEGMRLAAPRCVARYNIVYNCNFGILVKPDYASQQYNDSVYNNTVYLPNNGYHPPSWYSWDGTPNWGIGIDGTGNFTADSQYVFNNIVWANNGCNGTGYDQREEFLALYNQPEPDTIYSDYNCLYDPNTSYRVCYLGSHTLTSWKDGYNHDQNSIDSDPLFVSREDYDFHLQEDSPCRTRGRGGQWASYMGALAPGGQNPAQRRDIDRAIKRHKEGQQTDEEVEALIKRYMNGE